jgi:hypothetical protein
MDRHAMSAERCIELEDRSKNIAPNGVEMIYNSCILTLRIVIK